MSTHSLRRVGEHAVAVDDGLQYVEYVGRAAQLPQDEGFVRVQVNDVGHYDP